LHEDVPLTCLDGYPVYVQLTVTHFDHEGEPYAACIARDTTEKRHLERELVVKHTALWSAHGELERVVDDLRVKNRDLADRHRDLAVLSAQLSHAARRMLIGELSAGIAHSLNNPMAALVSAVRQIGKAVEASGDDGLRQAVGRYVQRAGDAAQRMD